MDTRQERKAKRPDHIPRRRSRFAICLLPFALATAPALAHDFWITPSTFRPTVGSAVKIGLGIGENFRGESARPDPRTIERFVGVSAAAEMPVIQVLGPAVAGLLRVDRAGPLILAYESKPSTIELPADKF